MIDKRWEGKEGHCHETGLIMNLMFWWLALSPHSKRFESTLPTFPVWNLHAVYVGSLYLLWSG